MKMQREKIKLDVMDQVSPTLPFEKINGKIGW